MARPIDTMLEIHAPEHLAFRTRLAGPGRRVIAYAIDLVIRGAIFIACALGFTLLGMDSVGQGLLLLALFVLDWGYYFACELITGGRSPGKLALKLRVVQSTGLPIGWRESALRNLARAADITLLPGAILLLGPLVMACDRKFRRLGDLVAGTIVILETPTAVTTEAALPPDQSIVNTLPTALPLNHEDLEAIELFVNRKNISTERREELAEMVSQVYAHRLGQDRPKNASSYLASLWAKAQDPSRRIAP